KGRHATNTLSHDIVEISDNFSGSFWNAGVMRNGRYFTIDTETVGNEIPIPLRDILQDEDEVPERFYLTDKDRLEKFKYLRGPKKIERVSANGHQYIFSEGGMAETDDLN